MIRLGELRPRWTTLAGWASHSQFALGISFLCPHCEIGPCPTCGHDRSGRLGLRFWPPIDPSHLLGRMFDLPLDGYARGEGIFERESGDTFDTLSIRGEVYVSDHAGGIAFEIKDGHLRTDAPLARWASSFNL